MSSAKSMHSSSALLLESQASSLNSLQVLFPPHDFPFQPRITWIRLINGLRPVVPVRLDSTRIGREGQGRFDHKNLFALHVIGEKRDGSGDGRLNREIRF